MKKTMTALLMSIFISQPLLATIGVDVYGELVVGKGFLSFRSLEKESFGTEVVLDGETLENFNPGCDKGFFTLIQSLRKDNSYQVVDVVCERTPVEFE